MAKCSFYLPSVYCLRHVIDASSNRPDKVKVKAILECPVFADVYQLCLFLGIANYYGKLVPNL